MHQVVERRCSDWLRRGRRVLPRGGCRRLLGGQGGDVDADAGVVRVELEAQPLIRCALDGEGRGPAAEHRCPVAVLEDRVAQPRQYLPRAGAQQGDAGAEQGGSGGVDERDPALEVQGAAAHRQALGERHRRHRPGSPRVTGAGRGQQPRFVGGHHRVIAGCGSLQEQVGMAAEGDDRVMLARAQLRWVPDRPLQHEPAPHGGTDSDRGGCQHEVVGQNEPEPGVTARHLLLVAYQHQAPFAYGVRYRDLGVDSDAHPRSDDLPGCPRYHRQPQHPFPRRQQIHQTHRCAGVPHNTAEGGVDLLKARQGRN